MKRKFGIFVLLAAASFTFTAENCVLENKDIEVPLRGDVDIKYHTTGFSDSNMDTVDFTAELAKIQAEAGDDIESLVSGGIEGGFTKLDSTSVSGTRVEGSIDVTRMSTSTTVVLIPTVRETLDTRDTSLWVPAPLQAVGVDLLTDGFNEYISWYNGDQTSAPPDLRYIFTWSSISNNDADFYWRARLRFILTGVYRVEVPDIWK